MWRIYPIILIYLISIDLTQGNNLCVWIRGAVRCRRDPTKQMNVEVRVYDRDGWWVLKMLNMYPDELMGVTFTDRDGTISLDGCGEDFKWFPFVPNYPDPYVVIRHHCNSEAGETLKTFVLDTHNLGVIELDSPQMYYPKKNFQTEEIQPKMPEYVSKHEDLIPNSVQRVKFFKTKDNVQNTSAAISEVEKFTNSLETDSVFSLESNTIGDNATTQATRKST